MEEKLGRRAISRRRFIEASSLAAVAGAAPAVMLSGKSATGRSLEKLGEGRIDAGYLRRDVTSPDLPASVLDSYRAGVEAMLKLPPNDPRNWYRQAMLHILDCPHRNWWFLPWHRGYVGWFERICRALANNQEFALPYWDWTASPRLPAAFFDGVLDPANSLFHQNRESFENALREPVGTFWNRLTPLQSEQLALRGYQSLEAFWSDVVARFRPREGVRDLSVQSPDLPEGAKLAVALENVDVVFRPRQFANFASGKSMQHNEPANAGLLESGPHNMVHSGIGGLMGDFLSPIDPVFYLHHANVDRLWGEWSALQLLEEEPHLPQGEDLARWGSERFEFFHGEAGMPVVGHSAASYADTVIFDYAYQPASATISRPPPVRDDLTDTSYAGKMLQNNLSVEQPAIGEVLLPVDVIDATVPDASLELAVRVTMQSPMNAAAWHFHLWLSSNDSAAQIDQYIGEFYVFGSHAHSAHDHPSVTFSIPLSWAIRRLAKAGRLDPRTPLKIRLTASLSTRELPGEDSLQVEGLAVTVV